MQYIPQYAATTQILTGACPANMVPAVGCHSDIEGAGSINEEIKVTCSPGHVLQTLQRIDVVREPMSHILHTARALGVAEARLQILNASTTHPLCCWMQWIVFVLASLPKWLGKDLAGSTANVADSVCIGCIFSLLAYRRLAAFAKQVYLLMQEENASRPKLLYL